MMKRARWIVLLVSISMYLSLIFPHGVKAYYGSYGGYYGGYYGNPYGFYGLASMYGNNPLSLYGLSGLGGLYGLGGLGGFYGLGSMMSGLYGLSGFMNPFGLQNMYYSLDTGTGLNFQVPFLQIAPILGVAGLYNAVFPQLFQSAPTISAPVVAEQIGLWQGLWTNGIYNSPMTLNLAQDPLTLGLIGTAQLLNNYILGIIVNVTGTSANGQVIVSGTGLGIGSQIFELQLVGTLITTTNMQGTYTLINTSNATVVQSGTFNLTLTTPVI